MVFSVKRNINTKKELSHLKMKPNYLQQVKSISKQFVIVILLGKYYEEEKKNEI